MSEGAAPGRREGILLPILLPIVVIIIVGSAITGLGTLLLAVSSTEKTNAVVLALVFTVAIMVICSFVYVLSERNAESQ